MTRKDYRLIAQAVADAAKGVEPNAAYTRIANFLATALACDNPRFDRSRFLAACGIDKEEG